MESHAEHIIYLVHGTWGKRSKFLKENSKLREAFTSSFIETRIHTWSGRNSFHARWRAAEDLAAKLKALPEGTKISIVGHSHGGAIAHLAALNARRKERIQVFTLATPFLYSRERVHSRQIKRVMGIGAFVAVPLTIIGAAVLSVRSRPTHGSIKLSSQAVLP